MKKIVKIGIVLAAVLLGLGIGVFIYHKANIQEFVDRKVNESAEKDVVATISGKTLSEKECVAYLAALKFQIEAMYTDEIWDYKLDKDNTTFDAIAKESMLEKLIYIKLVCANAAHYDVSLSSEDKVDVNGYVQRFFAGISKETAAEYGLTTELMTKIYSENLLATKVYKKITLNYDPKLTEMDCKKGLFDMMVFEKCYVDENGNIVYFEEDELANIKNKVNEAYQLVLSGSFETAAEKYCPNDETEVYLGVDDLPADIAQTVMKLQEEAVSQVLDSYDAYFIIRCKSPYDEAETQKAYQKKITELRDQHFKDVYAIWYSNATIDINRELWDEIPLVGDK